MTKHKPIYNLVDTSTRRPTTTGLWTRVLISLAFVALIAALYPYHRESRYKYEQGRPWNYAKLIAPFDVPIRPDSLSAAAAIDSINQRFVPIYRFEDVDINSIMATVRSRLADADSAKITPHGHKSNNAEAFVRALHTLLAQRYNKGVMADSLPASMGTHHRATVRVIDNHVLRTLPVRPFSTVSDVLRAADSLATVHHIRHQYQTVGMQALVVPSLVCDVEESARVLANENALVTIDRGVIQRGQTIIDKGAIISAQDFTNIRTFEDMAAGQYGRSSGSAWVMVCGHVLYVLLIIVAFMGYTYFYEPKIWNNLRAILFLLSMVTVAFVVTIISADGLQDGMYLVPLAIVPIMTMVFFNARMALWSAFVTILLCAGISTYPLEFIFLEFVAMVGAVFSLRDLTKRQQLLGTAAAVLVAYWCAYIALQMMMNGSFDDFSLRTFICLGVSAVLTSMSYVAMSVIERMFGFISKVTLIELSDTNTPLLRQLSDECPGTFQHSVAVSTLAGDAARAIGADDLLVRAGAMYHDIGKMDNPIFFTENQHGVNPHDGLSPARSAEIVIGHVTDGLRRADREGLPESIKDFIAQHHGHGRAKYFYVTACNASTDGNVDPAPFTYPGPNPLTRETSVMMMADAVEAASRSLSEHTPEAIMALVDKIIDGQIADGLHNDSQLAFGDVPRIKEAMARRLLTMYHSRVKYPDRHPA